MQYQSVFKDNLFADQTMIVTGAGSGIGRFCALELASLGARVVLVGRKLEKLERVQQEISQENGTCSAYSVDIRDEERVTGFVSEAVAAHGRIHGLVNNAGGQFPSPVSAISKKGWDAVVATNLTGGFLMAREVYKQSMAQNGGAIVNMLADMWRGMPGMAHSGAARAGMLNLTQTMAVEWASSGVRVNAVAPGFINSSGMDTYEDPMMKEMIPKLKESVPLHRMGTEAEIAAPIVFLLTQAAAFISGAVIEIDGAASCNTKMFPLMSHDNSQPYTGFNLE